MATGNEKELARLKRMTKDELVKEYHQLASVNLEMKDELEELVGRQQSAREFREGIEGYLAYMERSLRTNRILLENRNATEAEVVAAVSVVRVLEVLAMELKFTHLEH